MACTSIASRWLSSVVSRRRPLPLWALRLKRRRSPAPLRYGWAVALTGLVVGELLFSCDRPLSEPVQLFLRWAGLQQIECPAPPAAEPVKENRAKDQGGEAKNREAKPRRRTSDQAAAAEPDI